MPSSYKFTNGINYILAARQAAKQGADDALMETLAGDISETTIANIFWRKGQTVFSPSGECELLPGITRRIVINLIQKHPQWSVEEGKYSIDHLANADAVWVCNSVRELLAVRAVNDQHYDVDDTVLNELKDQFHTFVNDNLKPLH